MTNPPPFPTTLSDLSFPTTPTIYQTLASLRKSTLSIPNRLTSILSDSTFTLSIAHHYSLPLIANERCGSWYIPPSSRSGSAYFKSTDGHYGHWDFSLRRLNVNVLELLGENGGGVLVDSTRRGKRISDALRRTVPVWVGVWNRVLFPEREGEGRREGWWDVRGEGLEQGEVVCIEERMDGWIAGLKGLGLDLEGLRARVKRPIKCFWVVNGEGVEELEIGEWNPFVLCSASRRVLGAEMSEDGYIQGAGDDSENWAGGLTSSLFWQHKDLLMNTPEEELPDLIRRLGLEETTKQKIGDAVLIAPTKTLYLGVGIVDDTHGIPQGYDAVVSCNGLGGSTSKNLLQLKCRSGKLGSRDLREKLAPARSFMTRVLDKDMNSKTLIICETGKDLSVGVMVMVLCMCFDDQGRVDTSTVSRNAIDKQLVKQRLAWITSAKPDANPSRSTLQAVNSFMMNRPS